MDILIEEIIDEIEFLKVKSPNMYHAEGFHGECEFCKKSMFDVSSYAYCPIETNKEKDRIRITSTDLYKLKELLLQKLTIEDRKFLYDFIDINNNH